MHRVNDSPVFVELDRDQLTTLAHPFRLRLLSALRVGGASTATALAERLDTNSGKTSYHLRALAQVGLVVEEPGRGRGRERWWRAAHDVSVWSTSDFDEDPDARAAADWLVGHAARAYAERIEHWITNRAEWPARWTEAADMSDLRLRLGPQGLRQLNDDLLAVIRRYLEDQAPSDDDAAVECTVIVTGFPDPDPPL
jgi:DNA-binding transcriptional ArsR family regulator